MTMRKLFSSLAGLLRRTKVVALFSLGAASMLCGFADCAKADKAPDWLRTIAQEKLPDYPKDTVAVVLLDEVQTTVKDNGEIETRTRRAYKLLRPEARDEYGGVVVDFDSETKLTFLKAWTITSDGRELEVKEKDAAEASLTSYELFSDVRAKFLKFPEANPGSVVGFECVQRRRPFVFDDSWYFQKIIPVHRSRFSLQLPAGWEFSTLWANHPEVKPQSPGPNQYVWELTDNSAVEVEPEMPAWNTLAGHMHVKYFPRDPAMRSKTTGSWKDIGLWDYSLIEPRRVDSPAIRSKVGELTSSTTDLLEKIKALAAFSQHQIRYVAIEIGIGGLQPHAADDVFAHQYGDCKDKATLLNTMLREIGVESYNVSINTERGIVAPEFPSTSFDHVILAIRLPDIVPDANLFAIVKHPRLGRLLFFDPTDEYVPLGYLPSDLQDSYALISTPEGGELVRTPLLPPATNRLIRTAKLSLSSTGDLSGEVQEVRWGGPASDRRGEFLSAPPAKRAKIVEDFLGSFLNNFTLTNAKVENLERYDDSLTLNYDFAVVGYAKTAGNLLIVRPRVLGNKEGNILDLLAGKPGKPRMYPIELGEASRQDDVFDITLPPGYVPDDLPQPVRAECEFASYQSEVQVTGNVLHYKRTYEVKSITVPTQKLADVKAFFRQVAADERSSAVFRRAN
jgi:transglutaminase-like putative cysteine protease